MPEVYNIFSPTTYKFDYIGSPVTWTCDDCGHTDEAHPPPAGWHHDPHYQGHLFGQIGIAWGWHHYTEAEVDDITVEMVIDMPKDHWYECPHSEYNNGRKS